MAKPISQTLILLRFPVSVTYGQLECGYKRIWNILSTKLNWYFNKFSYNPNQSEVKSDLDIEIRLSNKGSYFRIDRNFVVNVCHHFHAILGNTKKQVSDTNNMPRHYLSRISFTLLQPIFIHVVMSIWTPRRYGC